MLLKMVLCDRLLIDRRHEAEKGPRRPLRIAGFGNASHELNQPLTVPNLEVRLASRAKILLVRLCGRGRGSLEAAGDHKHCPSRRRLVVARMTRCVRSKVVDLPAHGSVIGDV